MGARRMAKAVWAILMSRNVNTAKVFYGSVLGWRFEPFAGGAYPTWIARNDEGRSVAVFVDTSNSDFPDAAEMWLPYFVVKDLDDRIAAAEAFGATLLRPPIAIPNAGRIALMRQPGGGVVGWITASPDA